MKASIEAFFCGFKEKEMVMLKEIYYSKDKWETPFLMAASFNGLLRFEKSTVQNGALHWLFSPRDKAVELIKRLRQKSEPRIPFLDFMQAVDSFWKEVAEMRNEKRNDYGGRNW